MAIGVDSSKWKPRHLTGTPANKASIIVALSTVTIGVICGIGFHYYSQYLSKIKERAEALYPAPIEEVEKRAMIGSGALRMRTGDTIRKLMEESERVDLPWK